jgi:CPA2 family monovalent cation:H+ antiporter-2
VQTLAEIGVALLLFGLGSEFSFGQLAQVRNGAVFGGILQILLTIGLGVGLGLALHTPLPAAIFLGAILALSSSVVIIKVMMGRGEMDSLAAKLAIGVAIMQDLSLVPLMVILPALAETGRDPLALIGDITGAMITALIFLGLVYVIGTRIVPLVLTRIAANAGRELFLITVSVIALGTALLAQAVGVSFAIGAFLGGLLVSESELAHHALEEIGPLRDIFAAIFFVSVGMLIDPFFVLGNIPLIILFVVVILVGKGVIASGLFLLFRYPLTVSLKAGLVLTQIGEFSFVLAALGVSQGIITPELQALVLASAVVTIIATPLLVNQSDRLAALLRRVPGFRRAAQRAQGELAGGSAAGGEGNWKRHIVVCGYGRVGREVVDASRRRGFTAVVIELDPYVVQRAVADGVPCLYGDAAQPGILARARVEACSVLTVTMPDLAINEQVVREARRRYPRLMIVARAQDLAGIARLRAAGATDVVQPEVEAGLEFVRRTMRKMGLAQVEIHTLLSGRRHAAYEGAHTPAARPADLAYDDEL